MDKEPINNKPIEQKETETPDKAKSKKGVVKYILNISLVLIVTGLAVFLALKDDADKIWTSLVDADFRYLLVVLGLMFGAMLTRSFILFCFAHLFTRKYYFHQAIAVEQIGEFYNAIPPGASEGQIMQA